MVGGSTGHSDCGRANPRGRYRPKAEIYALFDELVHEGMGILVISSDLPEVLALADRILIMRHGRLTGEVARAEATEERVMHLAALGTKNGD